MSLVQVIVLAVVQGLTEFLPVSSSAHLVLVSQLFGWPDSGLAFDIALHIGTLLAVLVYFFKDWVQIVAQGLGIGYKNDAELSKNRTLLWLLAVASLPIGFFGFVFNKQAETSWRSPYYVIGTMLIVVGLIMALAERISEKGRGIGDISFFDSIVIGFSQALAIVPGTSRSGITISAGLFRGLTRESAARFSFLLSTPAIAAAAAKSLHDLLKEGGLTPEVRTTFLLGILISAIVGGVVIKYFMKYLRHSTLNFFVYYRIVFGIIVIALASFFRHSAG